MIDRPTPEANSKGFVTVPAEIGHETDVLELAHRWGADAVRDSDGTQLPDALAEADLDVYSTICLVRADQDWPRAHPGHLVGKYLMSEPVSAVTDVVEIPLLQGYFTRKHAIDHRHDPHGWWEVMDRTAGQVLAPSRWEFVPQRESVVVRDAIPFHLYTVSFLTFQTWDSTSMYNHLTNGWKGDPIMSIDPYVPEAYRHLMAYFDRWLEKHPSTDIVRLTTLAYHFTIDSDAEGRDKHRDWLGYTDCVSPLALEDFARENGYRLTPEDFVDRGFYNNLHRVPSGRHLDWMAFIHEFVVRFGKDLTDRVHKADKRAAIFWGDHWIGVEPYSDRFQEMGVDINIGACEDGAALRRLADAPGLQEKEIRLYPYFFPDVFRDGGDPTGESRRNWAKIRRALLRRCVDRIGYGGYPSQALKFPDFVEHVAGLCDEFRMIRSVARQGAVHCAPVKVAVLNAWGKWRSWVHAFGRTQKFHFGRDDITEITGSNLLECLAGLPVDVTFISFRDIQKNGIPAGIDVIINDGDAGTAWSGGRHWGEPEIVAALRAWIYRGGGFIGVREPSAFEAGGCRFQLSDVMGVEQESGSGIETASKRAALLETHFITEDLMAPLDCFCRESYVFASDPATEVLARGANGHVLAAVHGFGGGRSVYLAGLPYSPDNSRLLYRAILWAARQESALRKAFSSNAHVDCAVYPECGVMLAANATPTEQKTQLYGLQGETKEICLKAYDFFQWNDWEVVKRVSR